MSVELEDPTDAHYADMWMREWNVIRFNKNLIQMYEIYEKTNKIRNGVLIISENKLVQIFKEKINIEPNERPRIFHRVDDVMNPVKYKWEWLAGSDIKRQVYKLHNASLIGIDKSGRYDQLVITKQLIDYIKKHLNQDG